MSIKVRVLKIILTLVVRNASNRQGGTVPPCLIIYRSIHRAYKIKTT
jgi:hypothetical protein